MTRRLILLIFLTLSICPFRGLAFSEPSLKQSFWIHPKYQQYAPRTIAILPMDNYSLEPDVERVLFDEICNRLKAKGYLKIAVGHVREVMKRFGIQTPGQLEAISTAKLCSALQCDALLEGEINQCSAIHEGLYEALVISCSVRLKSCRDRLTLWETDQWRVAHRQWNLDPFNMLINAVQHENASRSQRIAFLVEQMLKTLPQGPVNLVHDNLLEKAIQIKATTK